MNDLFADLPKNHFGAILADPPWSFDCWDARKLANSRAGVTPYQTMGMDELKRLPVGNLAAKDCALFCWIVWPTMPEALEIIVRGWGFKYKTCGFSWMKANNTQIHLFDEEISARAGMGYWTLSNSEVCLLATRGKPKRLNADVRQGIIAPRREHSRKPDGIHERIERLVAGPYLELFARQSRPGWTTWGNERTKFDTMAGVAQ